MLHNSAIKHIYYICKLRMVFKTIIFRIMQYPSRRGQNQIDRLFWKVGLRGIHLFH